MKTSSSEGKVILRSITSFLQDYAPYVKTGSEHTLRNYATAIDQYLEWLEDKKNYTDSSISAECFETKMIEEWLIWLQTDKDQSKSTSNVRLASLRTFIRYLSKQNLKFRYLSEEARDVSRLKTPKRKIHGISRDGVKTLLSVISSDTVSGRRYLVMIMLLYSSAARLDEVLSLKVKDLFLDRSDPYMRVRGKGSKYRNIPILEDVKNILCLYLQSFHGDNPDDDAYVFYTKHKGQYEKMSQTAVRKALKKYAEKANEINTSCPINLHPHQLRHAKATHLLEDGLSDVIVAEFLGHSGLETIQDYIDVSIEQSRKSLNTLKDEQDRNLRKKWKKAERGNSIRIIAGTMK